jgi:thioredoxin-related protein
MIRILLSLTLLLTLKSLSAQNKQIAFQNISLDQAFKLAKETSKIIFVVCHNKTVVSAKAMEREVYIHDAVSDKFNNKFINLKLDFDLGDGKKIVQKYRVKNYPTFLFLDPSGNVVFQKNGYLKPMDMLKLADDAGSPENEQRIAKAEYLKAKNNPNAVYQYLWFLRQRKLPEEKVLDDYWTNIPEAALVKSIHWYLIKDFANNLSSRAAKRFVLKREVFMKLIASDSIKEKIADLYYLEALRMSNNGATFVQLDALRKEAFNLKMDDSGATTAFVDLVIADKRQNWLGLTEAVNTLYVYRKPTSVYQEEDFTRMLLFYINYFIPKNEIKQAKEWALAIKNMNHSPAQLMETANILLELKDQEKAVILAEQAVIEKKKRKENPFLIERFMEKNGKIFDQKINGYTVQSDSVLWTFEPKDFKFATLGSNGAMTFIESTNIQSVHLAGSFNDWNKNDTPLSKDSMNETWSLRQPIRIFRSKKDYEFRFLVNGIYWVTPTIYTKNRRLGQGKTDELSDTNFIFEP